MYKYLFFEGMAVQPDTLKRYCDTSAENLEWLSGHGVQFGTGVYLYSTTYPPNGYFLYYSGMERRVRKSLMWRRAGTVLSAKV